MSLRSRLSGIGSRLLSWAEQADAPAAPMLPPEVIVEVTPVEPEPVAAPAVAPPAGEGPEPCKQCFAAPPVADLWMGQPCLVCQPCLDAYPRRAP